MKLLSLLLIAILFIQGIVEAASVTDTSAQALSHEDTVGESEGLSKRYIPRIINCGYECSRRCSKASRRKICLRSCTGCCARCHCVPPGTSGNTHLCPCYARIRTHGNRLKCP